MAFLSIIAPANFVPETFRQINGMEIEYIIKSFGELTNDELYGILKLRSDVFVVEQNSIYRDMDNKDQESYHLLCVADQQLAGYTRLLPTGLSYTEASMVAW
jgi:ElaA protein